METAVHTGITFIGMDLGSFKTSVASSTGARDVIYSAVGWPRDRIARSMLGRDVVFGQDTVEQRLALDIVRPFEKGILKYNEHTSENANHGDTMKRKEAARLLVEHAVSLTGPSRGLPIYGVIGAPARASVASKKIILDAARTSFDAAMIVSEPFSIAYGMNRLADTLVIDIGAGTIDLCPMYGSLPQEEDQVTLAVGGDLIDENLMHLVRKAHPGVQLSWNMVREIKEKYGYVHEANDRVLVALPVSGKPKQVDITEPLKAACRMVVAPILHGLKELIGRIDPEFQARMLNNIILGGGGSQLKGLDRVIEEGLKEYGGGKVKRVGDAVYAGAVGALKMAMAAPLESWSQMQMTPRKHAA